MKPLAGRPGAGGNRKAVELTTEDYSSTFFKVQGTRTMYLLKNWLDSLSNAIVIIPLDVTDTPNPDDHEPTATPREDGDQWMR